jgi:hypothetical protein
MNAALKGKPVQAFSRPGGLAVVVVCQTTGMLPGPVCPTRNEYFIPGTVPTEICFEHSYSEIEVCCFSGMLPGPDCRLTEICAVSPENVPTSACVLCENGDPSRASVESGLAGEISAPAVETKETDKRENEKKRRFNIFRKLFGGRDGSN